MAGVTRAVHVTMAEVRGLTVRELVQACRVTDTRRAEVGHLLDAAMDPYGDPEETAHAVDLVWAMAWQIVRRSEPAATWTEAQEWDVTVGGEVDAGAEDLDALRVEAAVLTGLPPDQADQITLSELDAYRIVRAGGS